MREFFYLLLMHLHFYLNCLLLIFTSLVLEPNTNDSRRQTSHLTKLLFDQWIGPWIHVVARSQHAQLFLIEHRSHAGWLAIERMCVLLFTIWWWFIRVGAAIRVYFFMTNIIELRKKIPEVFFIILFSPDNDPKSSLDDDRLILHADCLIVAIGSWLFTLLLLFNSVSWHEDLSFSVFIFSSWSWSLLQ